MLNLDKIEVSTDGILKLSGGQTLTNLSSAYGDLPKVATISNRSGYKATFIEGINLQDGQYQLIYK